MEVALGNRTVIGDTATINYSRLEIGDYRLRHGGDHAEPPSHQRFKNNSNPSSGPPSWWLKMVAV